jgi:hypothetical protein
MSVIREDEWVYYDVDDVLVAMSPELERALRAMTGRHLPCEQWPNHNFLENYGLSPDRHEEMVEGWRVHEIMEQAKIHAGVREAMMASVASGRKAGLITARGWHAQGRELTKRLVEENGLPISDIIVVGLTDKKADKLVETGKSIVGFVDDSARHVAGCRAEGIPAVLLDRPWNQTAPKELPRVQSLAQFPAWVDEQARLR